MTDRIPHLTSIPANWKPGEASPWRPIETAPRDGSEFLAYYPADENGRPAFMEVTLWREMDRDLNAFSWTVGGADPSYWMPLPPPPPVQEKP